MFLDENNKPLCKVIAWMDTRATKEAKELTEQFEKQDIIKKVGFDGIYAIHPVSKILAVKHKNTRNLLKRQECLHRLRIILSLN